MSGALETRVAPEPSSPRASQLSSLGQNRSSTRAKFRAAPHQHTNISRGYHSHTRDRSWKYPPLSLSLSLSLFPRRSCWLLTPGPRSNSSPFYLKFIHPGAPPLELPLNAPRGPRAPEPTSSLPWTSPRAPLGPLSRVSWRVRHPRSVLPASPRFQTSIGPSTP